VTRSLSPVSTQSVKLRETLVGAGADVSCGRVDGNCVVGPSSFGLTVRKSTSNNLSWRLCFAPVVLLASCSFVEVSSVADLEPDQKVIVGDVQFGGDDASDWVPGLLTDVTLRFDYDLPVHDGRVRFLPGDGSRAWAENPGLKGGVFHIAVKNRTVTLLGLQAHSTALVVNYATAIPLFVEIAPSASRCEFVGTILLKKVEQHFEARIVDTYDRFKSTYQGYVSGCDLTKAIAAPVSPEKKTAAVLAAAARDNSHPQTTAPGQSDGRRSCRDRADFDTNRNCVLAPAH
jgi:hypothetical protein